MLEMIQIKVQEIHIIKILTEKFSEIIYQRKIILLLILLLIKWIIILKQKSYTIELWYLILLLNNFKIVILFTFIKLVIFPILLFSQFKSSKLGRNSTNEISFIKLLLM